MTETLEETNPEERPKSAHILNTVIILMIALPSLFVGVGGLVGLIINLVTSPFPPEISISFMGAFGLATWFVFFGLGAVLCKVAYRQWFPRK